MKRLSSWIKSVPSVSSARRRRGFRRAGVGPAPACAELLEPRTLLTGAPMLASLGEIHLLGGSPLYVPLNGTDPEGQALTYTVTSDSPLVSTYVPEGNRSLRVSVAGYGDMVFELFEDKAPRVTEHIIELAELGYYDGVIFHRIVDNFVIQGGDRTGTGGGGSVLGDFDDQFHVDLQHNRTGLLSMAKGHDDTNDSQFFITEGPQRHLDFNHSIFGLLVEGEDVRQQISGVETDPDTDRPLQDVVMEAVTVFEDHTNGVMMLKAAEGASGTANITVTVTDSDGNSSQRTFRVIVEPDTVDSSPFLAEIPQIVTLVDKPVTFALEAMDVEGGLTDGVDILYLDQHVLNYYKLHVPVQAPPALQYSVDFETGLVTVTPTNGLVGDHQFTVAIFDAAVGSFDYQVVDIRILGQLPRPELTGPAAVTIDTTPAFAWNALDGAARYDLWVNDLTTGQSGVIRKTDVDGTAFTPTTKLVPGHEYLWTVRGFTASGDPGEWAVHRRFRVAVPDSVPGPTPTGPGGAVIDVTPTFTWTAVSGAARYDLWVNDLTTGQSGVIRKVDVVGTQFTPTSPLKAGHSYLFAVRAINDEGVEGAWGGQRIFALAAAPTITTPVTALANAKPTFEWSAVPGAAGYFLWVNDLTTGQSGVVYEANLTETRFTPSTPLAGGHRYLWTVRAYDTAGEAGEWAAHRGFQLAATLTNPLGATIDATPTFKWTPVDGAARYDLWVNDLTTGQSGVIRQTTLTEATYTPSTPLAVGHSYLWTVQAIGANHVALPWGVHQQFTVINPTAAAPPAILSGSGQSTDTTPTFQWEAVNGAHHYDLWVNDLSTGQGGVIRVPNVSGTSYTPTTPLALGHKYIWTVRAINDAGIGGEWTPHRTLMIHLGVPELAAPQSGAADATPKFEWTAVEGAVRYDVWVNDTTTGQSGVIRNANVTSTHLTAPVTLTTGHRYLWTVRAINEDGAAGNWAPHRAFTIGTLPAPQLQNPGSFTVDTTPTFEWTALDGAARYDVWVNDATTGQSGVIRETHVSGTNLTPSVILTPGHRYVWTVRGINDEGVPGAWAAHGNVTVTPMPAPNVTSPGLTTTHTTPTFEWATVTGADHYELEVHDATTGESNVIHKTDLTGNTFVPGSALVVGHTYHWRIRAVNADGVAGAWTAQQEFTLNALEAPQPLTAGGTVNSIHPEFRWTPVASAVRYDLWVNDLTTGQSQILRVTHLLAPVYQPPAPLISGHTYIWTVRAFNANGDASEWATHRQFTIQVSQVDEESDASGEIRHVAAFDGTEATAAQIAMSSRDSGADDAKLPAKRNAKDVETNGADVRKLVALDAEQPIGRIMPHSTAGEALPLPHDVVMEAWTRTDWWAAVEVQPETAVSELPADTSPTWKAGILAIGIPNLVGRWFRRRNRRMQSMSCRRETE